MVCQTNTAVCSEQFLSDKAPRHQGTHGSNSSQSRPTMELTCVDGLSAPLEQQQLIKGLKDVNGRLVDGADYGAACVDDVAHSSHDNGCCSCIQPCTHSMQSLQQLL